MIAAMVFGVVAAYSVMIGVCHAMLPDKRTYNTDNDSRWFAGGFWPVVMPALLASRAMKRVGEWRAERRDHRDLPRAEARRRAER